MALHFDLTAPVDGRALPDYTDAARPDAIIVGLFADGSLTPAAAQLDADSSGRLRALAARGDLSGKAGRSTVLHDLPGVAYARVLVVGLGEANKLGAGSYLKTIVDAVKALARGPVKSALCTLNTLTVPGRDAAWATRQAVVAADGAGYRYSATRKNDKEGGLERLSLLGDATLGHELARGAAIAAGIEFARELGNLPPNICNPAYLAQQARQLAEQHVQVSCEVIGVAEMEALGMGALLAVGRGSANAPQLIVLRWQGAAAEAKPHALVGKGITFDSGGLNLKVQGGIEEMKFDMCGAANVLGTFVAAVNLALPINLVCVVAAVENMADGNAYRPSDVLTTMSGKTVEVLNTDAEGRLILCDALTYARKFEPLTLIDVATLTGACVTALGKHASGLMSRDDDLANELLQAGERVHDRAWRLPIWDDYQPALDSAFADVANIGGKWAGAITAGCFLSRFTEGQRWAHLDIAGSAWEEGRKGMATGRPVGLLTQWLMDRC
jgi:leucyl aminopeptidase